MSKKINFVYEWIGPRGPITNNRIPTILDLADRQVEVNFAEKGIRHDLIQQPHFHERIVNSRILPAYSLPQETFLYELNFNNYHYRDLTRAFHHNDGLLDHNQISGNVLYRIKNKTAFFVVTLLFEGHLQDHFLSAMTNYFKGKNIPLSQVIYVSNCYNGQAVYEDFCRRTNQPAEMKMEYLPVFRVDKTDVMPVLTNPIGEHPVSRPKTFLCFNRRYNEHRVLFYTMMSKLGLLDKCHMSMAAIQPENSHTFKDNAVHFASKHPQFEITEHDIDVAQQPLPLVLDNTNFNRYPMEHSPESMLHLYNTSYVNIITETYFFSNIIHLTEKTYKPIAFKQPFILLAAPGSLQHIKDMGFHTFDSFWDESYDTELDHDKRFLKIIDIIKTIASWSPAELEKFVQDSKSIIEHNHMRLSLMQNTEIDDLVNKYGV
jgi:hypothetical protein